MCQDTAAVLLPLARSWYADAAGGAVPALLVQLVAGEERPAAEAGTAGGEHDDSGPVGWAAAAWAGRGELLQWQCRAASSSERLRDAALALLATPVHGGGHRPNHSNDDETTACCISLRMRACRKPLPANRLKHSCPGAEEDGGTAATAAAATLGLLLARAPAGRRERALAEAPGGSLRPAVVRLLASIPSGAPAGPAVCRVVLRLLLLSDQILGGHQINEAAENAQREAAARSREVVEEVLAAVEATTAGADAPPPGLIVGVCEILEAKVPARGGSALLTAALEELPGSWERLAAAAAGWLASAGLRLAGLEVSKTRRSTRLLIPIMTRILTRS